MIDHQDLRIFGNLETGVAALLRAAGTGDWVRRVDFEENVQLFPIAPKAKQYCFANAKLAAPAVVWLQDLRPYDPPCNEWRVGHVGPIEKGCLSTEQCNLAVRSFYEWAAPILEGTGAEVSLSDERQSPKDWMSPQLVNLLTIAVGHGYPTHPSDCERWNEFLVGTHQAGDEARMSPTDLERWLTDDQEWESDDAVRLALRYENGLELLKVYERLRAET